MSFHKLPLAVDVERVHQTVGLIALLLPFWLVGVTFFTNVPLMASISHYYYTPIGGDILVGSLLTIGTFFIFVYRVDDTDTGDGRLDLILTRLAGAAAMGVAYFPTTGTGAIFNTHSIRAFVDQAVGHQGLRTMDQPVAGVISFDFWALFGREDTIFTAAHYSAALILYLILYYYTKIVFTRPHSSTSLDSMGNFAPNKRRRNHVYALCAASIAIALCALVFQFIYIKFLDQNALWWTRWRLTFAFETLGLWAFGIAWCVKGRIFGLLRD